MDLTVQSVAINCAAWRQDVKVGMQLVSLAGEAVAGATYEDVALRLVESRRPHKLILQWVNDGDSGRTVFELVEDIKTDVCQLG